jgi:pimeloyl-ACP methyl ester carboxylesterase
VLNLELHDALATLGEHGPFVLVGHSFGGPPVRNFARVYPAAVAGIVFVDAAHEGFCSTGLQVPRVCGLADFAVLVSGPNNTIGAKDF